MSLQHRYLRLAARTDAEFDRNADRFRDRMQCRLGCTGCCHHVFQITAIEAEEVVAAVRAMPAAEQVRLQTSAEAYRAEHRELMAGRETARGTIGASGLRLPCPALDGDRCTVYDRRPLVCRRFGMPIYNAATPDRLQACELNFQQAEPFDRGYLESTITEQTAIRDEWAGVQRQAAADGLPGGYLTVADAILRASETASPVHARQA